MMNRQTKTMLLLTALFAVMMSLPWLVPHTGFLALFGIVPLLCLERLATINGTKRFWLWHYGAFVLWNALTTFWVCNATVGGGIFAVMANALQMSLIFGIFRFSKKHLRGVLPYIFLAVMWIVWERAYFDAQISWPWLTLGNAFARSTYLIQWYEFTGSLGGSLWIWTVNLGVFGLMVALSEGRWFSWNAKAKTAAVAVLAFILAGPVVISLARYHSYDEVSEGTMDVIIGQPNFDPYQKFTFLDQNQQDAILIKLFDQALKEREPGSKVMLLAPETFTSDIICGMYESSGTWRHVQELLHSHPGTSMIFGASSREYYFDDIARDVNDYKLKDGGWVQRHNSALSVEAGGPTEIFHKSKLVVGTEMTPFPRLILPLAEFIGVGIGRCVGQPEISLLHCDNVPIGCAVCYESVYGEYCTGYVKKGAKFLTVITNDAWWGNTPGYKQHLSYSSLRAIELRRDIARCGNTGISAFIDQKGDIVEKGPWWEPATLEGTVNFNSDLTFFAQHGDIVGRLCTFIFFLLLFSLVVAVITRKK